MALVHEAQRVRRFSRKTRDVDIEETVERDLGPEWKALVGSRESVLAAFPDEEDLTVRLDEHVPAAPLLGHSSQPCPWAVLNAHGRRGRSVRLATNFRRDRDPVAERHDRRDHPRVLRQPLVVGPDRRRLRGPDFAGHIAMPKDVVRDQEPADPETFDTRLEDRGITGLVDVVEDEVEWAFEIAKDPVRGPDKDPYLRSDAGLLEIFLSESRGLGIVLDRDQFAAVDEGASEPGPRIPDRGAELQDALRAQGPREDVEETPLRRTDNRPALLQALLLDRHEGGIAAVRQAIHVLVNLVVYNAGRQSTTVRPSAVPTHEPSRVVDKRLSGGGPHRGAGWDPCASSRRRTAPSCRGISRHNT